MLFGQNHNYKVVLPVVKKFCGNLSETLEVALDLDVLLLQECYKLAEQSCGFHGTGVASHVKQAAHFGFWLNKLRPVSTKQRLVDTIRKSNMAVSVIEAFDKKYSERIKRSSLFYINEFIAFMTIRDLIINGYKDIEERIDGDEAVMLSNQLTEINLRMDKSSRLMLTSFRHHVHSARAMATLFEIAYLTGFEHTDDTK